VLQNLTTEEEQLHKQLLFMQSLKGKLRFIFQFDYFNINVCEAIGWDGDKHNSCLHKAVQLKDMTTRYIAMHLSQNLLYASAKL
jgi:hypothetical protein